MALQDEINALRRLMESVNKLSSSNAASISKIMNEHHRQKECHETTKQVAERALQMCDALSKRVAELEARITPH